MATAKSAKTTAPKPIVEKSKGSGTTGFYSMQLLVEETPYQGYGYGSSKRKAPNAKPQIMSQLEDWLVDGRYDQANGDWAIKCVQIDEETFKTGYEAL